MATVTKTTLGGPGKRTVTETTLGASNTLAYEPGTGQILILRNSTASAITSVTIDGADGTTVGVPGLGAVDVSAGYSVGSIAAGAVVAIPLDTIAAYLQGAISLTGSGLTAVLLGQ